MTTSLSVVSIQIQSLALNILVFHTPRHVNVSSTPNIGRNPVRFNFLISENPHPVTPNTRR